MNFKDQVGTKFWEMISDEHGLDTETGHFSGVSSIQAERLGVYWDTQVRDNWFLYTCTLQ